MNGVRGWRRVCARALAGAAFILTAVSCDATGPNEAGDDWAVSTPAAEGMDPGILDTLVSRLEAGDYGEVHSLVIVRHGRLVLERYFQGWTAADLHPLYSVTKSVTALLLGSARDAGISLGLDERLLEVLRDGVPVANPSEWKSAITLEDVLTMRAGFLWDEAAAPYGTPGNPTAQLAASDDWIGFMLGLPMAEPPGTRFRYNSGSSVLLGAMLAARAGKPVVDLARTRLFGPLQITDWAWARGPDGVTNTGWGLSMRPRDLAKIGQVVLAGGVWRERRLISEAWVRDATFGRVALTGGFGYGYQWWSLPTSAASGTVALAWGWGDQFVFVAPELELVVVTTGGNYGVLDDDQALTFVPLYVFRAAGDSRPVLTEHGQFH